MRTCIKLLKDNNSFKIMNYSTFLNSVSLARKPSAIRILTAIALQAGPSMISLAGGMPNAATFPFKEATFKMWNGDSLHFDEEKMKLALQYSASTGLPDFLKTCSKIQNHWHSSKHLKALGSNNVCITYGSTDGVSKSLEMLLSEGDGVLLEQPTNPETLKALTPLRCHLYPISSDHAGILPSNIHHAFNTFHRLQDSTGATGKMKCLYTSTSLPTTCLQRRREVMQLAKELDFLILEHDPFHFLTPLENRVASYLSLDKEGRVLRFDSLSHVFSPGIRIGMVSGGEELVARVVLHVMVSTMHCPSITQMMVNEVMKEMDVEGFKHFCGILTDLYEVRRKLALKAAEEHLSEFFDWEPPRTGFTLRLKARKDKKFDVSAVLEDLTKQKVYFLNGKDCYIGGKVDDELLFSFGSCDEEDIAKACETLEIAVRRHVY